MYGTQVNDFVGRQILTVSRWGRASYGGFNKALERLAEKMNNPEADEEDDLGEDVSAMEMIKRARANADTVNCEFFVYFLEINKFPVDDENDNETMNYEPISKKKKRQLEEPEPEDDTLHFKRPE